MSESKMKIFMLDDKNLLTELDLAGYRKMGVTVKPFSRFDECQKALQAFKPDVIIVNMDFKKIDAISATQYFKLDSKTSDIPIILTSVQSSAKLKKSALAAGADLFIEQPIPRPYFVEKMKQLLDHQTRSEERLEPSDITVEVKFGSETMSFSAGDISVGGILLNSDRKFEIGTALVCKFQLYGDAKPVLVEGEVVRIIKSQIPGGTGLGIRYTKFLGDSESQLQNYVNKNSPAKASLAFYL